MSERKGDVLTRWGIVAGLLALAAVPACGGGGGGNEDADADGTETVDGDDIPDAPDAEDARDRTDRTDTADDAPSTCGDGVADPGEECDDGNDVNTDACTNECLDAVCGDGIVRAGTEECDDGNTTSGDGCSATCELESCGNGTVETGEECDDGNDVNTDACTNACRNAECGDGIVWVGTEDCEGTATQECDTSCMTIGTQACTGCAWETTCTPPAETCDGTDEDCDTVIDNGLPCLAGTTVACTTTCGSTGTGTCSASCTVPDGAACAPPVEICDGIDNNCDGLADEGYACVAGTSVSCTNLCGVAGTGTCGGDCSLPAAADCSTPTETCNGLDDDCDTVADDGYDCIQGAAVACTTTCGSTGTGTCSATCTLPTTAECPIPAEFCNAADDDCDTTIDEGFPCVAGTSQICSAGSCSGTQICETPGCTWGTCNFGSAPTNDTCAGALPDISTGGVFVGNTCAATNDHSYTCGMGGTPAASADVLFQLVLPATRDVVIDTVGTAFDAVLFLRHAGSCPGTTADRCDDNTAGGTPGQARITWTGMPAGTYWVILDGAGAGNRGNYVLNVAISSPPPPANDVCSGAIALGAPGTYSGSTGTALNDHTPSCGAGAGPDTWYTFTLTARTLVYLDLLDGGTWNSVLQVRQGTCPAPSTAIGCSDDACGGNRSQWFGALDAGTYYVVVDGVTATDNGNFTLLWQYTTLCAGATRILADGDVDGTTAGGGTLGSAVCGGNSSPEGVYYVALCTDRSVTAETCDARTSFNTVLYYRVAGCNTTAEIGCNNDMPVGSCTATASGASSLTGMLRRGLNFIIVDGYMGALGNYRLGVTGL
jgi:cysteine-rich repeat protein